MTILKGIGAVLAGILFIVITHIATDRLMEGLGVFPPPEEGLYGGPNLLLALAYRIVFQIVGGYLTAMLAPGRPMLHVWILAVIGLISSSAAAISVIPLGLSPAWYPVALAVSSLPSVWLGGYLRTRRSAS
jgi:hypothetical protein